MNIKYRQLKGFALAADLGSFKAAADVMSITQPSFSVLIKELEDNLGVVLFERTARKCELTQAGRMFQRDVPAGLEQLEQAWSRMTEFAQGRVGRLSIATVGSISVGVIAKALGDFQKKFPQVPVTLHELRNDMVFDAVEKGMVEVGVAARLDDRPSLQFEPLFTDKLMLVAPKGHALEGRSVRWQTLARYPCILMSTGPAEYALRANAVEINPVFVVEHLATAVTMVKNGIGVTVLPSCVLPSLNMDGLACMPFEGSHATRNLAAAYRDLGWLSPAAVNFLQLLRDMQPPKGAGWQRSASRRTMKSS